MAEVPMRKDIGERIASLFEFDCIRISRILETAQYAVIFSILALFVGFAIDSAFHRFYPTPTGEKDGEVQKFTGKEAMTAAFWLVLQVAVSAVLIIYIRKLGDIAPFFFEFCPSKYVPHWKVKEVEGEIAIALIFVGIQTSIIDNLAILRRTMQL